jgi:glycosyltransferase involved in cell wall biosynthesis
MLAVPCSASCVRVTVSRLRCRTWRSQRRAAATDIPNVKTAAPRPHVAMALFGDLTYDSRVRKEAGSLAKAGYDVSVVCLAFDEDYTGLPPNVRVLVRRPKGPAVIPGSSNPFTRGPSRGFTRVTARLRWLVAYVRGLRAWGRAAIAAAGPVDAWHAHDLTGVAAIAPSLPTGTPLIYDSHELFLEQGTAAALPGPVRGALRKYERRLVARAAAVITVNDEIAAVLRRRYRPRRIEVVHNCPVLPPEQPRRSLIRDATGIPDGSPIVLYHGGFLPDRGIEVVIAALAKPGLRDAHLVLMGFGPMADDLRIVAGSEAWLGRMHVLDPVAPDSLLPWVASADVGVMVNPGRLLNDIYSAPNKLFECLAAGTPVVASDFPTFRRIIASNPEGALGAVCSPREVGRVAAAIESIIRMTPEQAVRLRERCRTAAREHWNWDREAVVLIDTYRGLLQPAG